MPSSTTKTASLTNPSWTMLTQTAQTMSTTLPLTITCWRSSKTNNTRLSECLSSMGFCTWGPYSWSRASSILRLSRGKTAGGQGKGLLWEGLIRRGMQLTLCARNILLHCSIHRHSRLLPTCRLEALFPWYGARSQLWNGALQWRWTQTLTTLWWLPDATSPRSKSTVPATSKSSSTSSTKRDPNWELALNSKSWWTRLEMIRLI